MALTPYEPTTWVNDSEPDIDATNLNKVEQGIKEAIDGVNSISNALTNQLSTDPTKYAGISIVNTLNTALNDLSNTVDTLNSNLSVIGTLQSKTGNSNTIAPNSMQWMCDWFTITAGTYLMGFNSVNTTNVDTYLKLSDSQPIIDVNPREILCANSGSAVKVVTITSDKWVSVLINNHSASNYTVFADPSAFFAWALRIK